MPVLQGFLRREIRKTRLLTTSREADFAICSGRHNGIAFHLVAFRSHGLERNWPHRSRSRETCPLESGIGGQAKANQAPCSITSPARP